MFRFPKYLEILAPETHTTVGKYNVYTGKKVTASGSSGQESKRDSASKKKQVAKGKKEIPLNGGDNKQKQTGETIAGAARLMLSELAVFAEKSLFKPLSYHVSCILGIGIEPLVYTPDTISSGFTQTQNTQMQAHATADQLNSCERKVTQLSDGAILKLLKSTVLLCSNSTGSGHVGNIGAGEKADDNLVAKIGTLRRHCVFQAIHVLIKRIQRLLSTGIESSGDTSMQESTEVPMENDVHMPCTIAGSSGVGRFDILEQIVILFGELLSCKDIQEDLISTGKSYVTSNHRERNTETDSFKVPIIIQISLDMSYGSEGIDSDTPLSPQSIYDISTCIERALRGIFDVFHSLAVGLLKHRAKKYSTSAMHDDDGGDSHIIFEDIDTEEHNTDHYLEAGIHGKKVLTSRSDRYMTYVVNIVLLLDKLLDMAAKLMQTQSVGVPDGAQVSLALAALLAPPCLPLKFSELCKSLLQYDWANSRLQDGGGLTGYTYSSKDLSLFVQLLLKHCSQPLENVKFIVNDLFMDELKVEFIHVNLFRRATFNFVHLLVLLMIGVATR